MVRNGTAVSSRSGRLGDATAASAAATHLGREGLRHLELGADGVEPGGQLGGLGDTLLGDGLLDLDALGHGGNLPSARLVDAATYAVPRAHPAAAVGVEDRPGPRQPPRLVDT